LSTSPDIDQEKCEKCKLCLRVCPVHMFTFEGRGREGTMRVVAGRREICMRCGQCMAVCKSGAVAVEGFEYGGNVLPLPESGIDYRQLMDLLARRRSVRNYKQKPVPRETLQQVLDAMDFAPYGAEPRKVEVTVVDDRQVIESALPLISKFLDDIVGWVESPIVSRLIRHRKGEETFSTLKHHIYPMARMGNYRLEHGDSITRGAPALLIFHAAPDAEEHTNNALIYATYAMLAAHSLGLGTSMISLVPAAINKLPEVKRIFRIPEKNEAVISLILGYPRVRYRRAIRRDPKPVDWVG